MSNVLNNGIFKTLTSGPLRTAQDTLGISKSNSLTAALDPMATAFQKAGNGPNTAENAGKSFADPGGFLGGASSVRDPKAENAAADAAAASVPHAPNQDNAANAAQQQADYLRKRRGILGNIFGGSQPNSTPVVSQKQLLGV